MLRHPYCSQGKSPIIAIASLVRHLLQLSPHGVPIAVYLFCDVSATKVVFKINLRKPLSSEKFTNLMRSRLTQIGIGPADVQCTQESL